MKDYIGTVNIWLYTTSASTTIEFVAKINEINKVTEDIMKKYEDEKIFEKNDNFTKRDELQLTCITINTSLKSGYFSLVELDTINLTKLINNTMVWLLDHQEESSDTYKTIIDEINDACNLVYHNTHKLKILETDELINQAESISTDSESDETEFHDEPSVKSSIKSKASSIETEHITKDKTTRREKNILEQPTSAKKTKITEDITSIINKLPDKPTKKKYHEQTPISTKNVDSMPDVLLKIDINKLNHNDALKFKI
jgi:hypothetical protein